MSAKLPPPDPFETLGIGPPDDHRLDAPAAVYLGGPPTPEVKRMSRLILDLRPGALMVAPQAVPGQPKD